ncbi:MAG: hypothetical protein Q4C77_01115 [Eubacteriales bacterium]|nr:hypothetical protein [Eubacteriales bacterium]
MEIMKEKIKAFFLSDWTLPEKILLLADVLLLGILIGFLTPLKNGIHFFSDNDMNNNNELKCEKPKKAE